MKNRKIKSQVRDHNILLSQRGEIKMNTSTVLSKKIYRRKEKYKINLTEMKSKNYNF